MYVCLRHIRILYLFTLLMHIQLGNFERALFIVPVSVSKNLELVAMLYETLVQNASPTFLSHWQYTFMVS